MSGVRKQGKKVREAVRAVLCFGFSKFPVGCILCSPCQELNFRPTPTMMVQSDPTAVAAPRAQEAPREAKKRAADALTAVMAARDTHATSNWGGVRAGQATGLRQRQEHARNLNHRT
ncbi:unnamed protein product, partial [Phaeothamnion confervicola]